MKNTKVLLAFCLVAALSGCGGGDTPSSSVPENNSSVSSSTALTTPNNLQKETYTDEHLAQMLKLSQLIIDNNLQFSEPIAQQERASFVAALVADESFFVAEDQTVTLQQMQELSSTYINGDTIDETTAFYNIADYDSEAKTLAVSSGVMPNLQAELLLTRQDVRAAGNDIVTFVFTVADTVPKETAISFIKIDDVWKIKSEDIGIKSELDIEALASEGFDVGGENILYTYTGSETSVQIPDDILVIGAFAFYGRDDVTAVTLPNTVTVIADKAFASCGLKEITVPASVTNIGALAFANYNPETDNTSLVAVVDGVEISSALASVVIEDGVKVIGYGAFADCAQLTAITIPSSVVEIADDIFKGCTALTTITVQQGSVAESYAKENGYEVEYIG